MTPPRRPGRRGGPPRRCRRRHRRPPSSLSRRGPLPAPRRRARRSASPRGRPPRRPSAAMPVAGPRRRGTTGPAARRRRGRRAAGPPESPGTTKYPPRSASRRGRAPGRPPAAGAGVLGAPEGRRAVAELADHRLGPDLVHPSADGGVARLGEPRQQRAGQPLGVGHAAHRPPSRAAPGGPDVVRAGLWSTSQVRHGPCHPHHAVRAARAAPRIGQQRSSTAAAPRRRREPAPEHRARDLRVGPPGGPAQSPEAALTGRRDAGRHGGRRLPAGVVEREVGGRRALQRQPQVDPVQQRAGQPGEVAASLQRGAAAGPPGGGDGSAARPHGHGLAARTSWNRAGKRTESPARAITISPGSSG